MTKGQRISFAIDGTVSPFHFVSIVQVGNKRFRESEKKKRVMDGQTDGRTDERSHRDAWTHLKTFVCTNEI